MGALLNYPQRRNTIGYRHRGYLPETGGVSWSRVEGLQAQAGNAPTVRRWRMW